MHIGQTIVKMRTRLGISQKELAAAMEWRGGEFDPGNLSKFEKGRTKWLSVEFLEAVLVAFHKKNPRVEKMTLSELFKEAEGGDKNNKDNDERDVSEKKNLVHVPIDTYKRLAKVVELWAWLTDETQEKLVKQIVDIGDAARHGQRPPAVRLGTEKKPKRKGAKSVA